ncbi:hypothetical protein M9Y10_013465, partial [Tritrichomonas musculus]
MILFSFILLFSVNSFRIFDENIAKSKKISKRIIAKGPNFLNTNLTYNNFSYNDMAFAPADLGKYTFSNCFFEYNNGEGNEPGSIHLSGESSLSISDCSFIHNTGQFLGGAILLEINEFDIQYSKFIENECTTTNILGGCGGSIFILKLGDTQVIKSCLFQGNRATTSGGAIHVWYNNTQPQDPGFKDALNVTDCQFLVCTADTGGAIYTGSINPSLSNKDGDMSIEGCLFNKCHSKVGGAIHFSDGDFYSDQQKIIFKCTFDDNTAESKGSCIDSMAFEITLDNCTFKNNQWISTSQNCKSFLSIVMDEEKKVPIINKVIFEENSGSTIDITVQDGSLNFTECEFRDYTSGIAFDSSKINSISTSFTKCNFTNLFGDDDTLFPISLTFGEFIFDGCILENNKHGTIKISGIKVTFKRCSFQYNKVAKSGASIYIGSSSKLINITNCNFCSNYAEQFGGSIFSQKINEIFISSCSFIANKADINGGALYLDALKSDIENCNFDLNDAYNPLDDATVGFSRGGSLYMKFYGNSRLSEGCTFTSSRAKTSGGALYVQYQVVGKDNIFEVIRCTFKNCSTEYQGGAISSGIEGDQGSKFDGDMLISLCEFENCNAELGGAIFFNDGTTENKETKYVTECTFTGCYATGKKGQGYAIFGHSYQINATSNTFKKITNNQQPNNEIHTVIYIEMEEEEVTPTLDLLTFEELQGVSALTLKINSYAKLNNLKFKNINNSIAPCINLDNWATTENVVFNDCEFSNITNARCVCMKTNTNKNFVTTFYNCSFHDNKIDDENVGNGSCILCQNQANVGIINCNFTKNTAVQNGGAIYAETNSIEISQSRFNQCCASYIKGKGGAVYLKQTTGEIPEFCSFNHFTDCDAGYSGGAIFVFCIDEGEGGGFDAKMDNLEMTISCCNFTNCHTKVEGGAISSGELNSEGKPIGDNDMTISDCDFTKCYSNKGGALYFQDGTKSGDEETLIQRCTFINCFAIDESREGFAIYCRSYKINITECNFKEHECQAQNVNNRCIVFVATNENGVAPILKNLTFKDNKGVSGLVIQSKERPTIIGLVFDNIQGLPCINLDNWDTKEGVNIQNSIFSNINDARCIFTSKGTNKFPVTIESCQFINNHIKCYPDDDSLIHSGCGASIMCQNRKDDDEQVYIENCNFTNNVADLYGGAIYAETNTIDLNGCRFELCSSAPESAIGRGGAVYMTQESGESFEQINLNTFIHCSASHSGGALFLFCREAKTKRIKENNKLTHKDDQSYMIFIAGSTFINCSSKFEGGAISSGLYNEETNEIEGDNDMQISGCKFKECKSDKGGALFFQDGTKDGDEDTSIASCNFTNCYASGHEGYAIYCRSYRITITECGFREHKQGTNVQKACIVYVETDETEIAPEINLLTFEYNKGVSGLVVKTAKSTTIEGLTFNNIQGNSPCLNFYNWNSKGNVFIKNSRFTNIEDARCISIKTPLNFTVYLDFCEFTDTSIKKSGTVPGSQVDEDSGRGGSILIKNQERDRLYIQHCEFTRNTAEADGGAIYAESSAIILENNIFTECSALPSTDEEGRGGALYIKQTGKSYEELRNNTFINCSAGHSGGGIFAFCLDKTQSSIRESDERAYAIIIENSNFTNCKSVIEGGAISSGLKENGKIQGDNDMEVLESYFTRCESGKGGALFFQDGKKEGDEETVIENSHFYECYANGTEHEGYAISCRSYQITVKNCDFHDHHSNDGIAQYGTRDCVVYVETNEEEVQPTISGLTFENNNAVSGLIVNVSSKNQVVVSGLKFINIQGEACINLDLWDAKTHVRIENSEFNNVHNSRCILASNKDHSVKVTLFRCQFENNSLENIGTTGKNILPFGSSIYLQGRAEATISQCNFTNNTASLCGGAIYAETQSVALNVNRFVKCSSSGTKENHGGYGGAVYLNQQSEEVMIKENYELLSGNTFIDCHSTISGGAIFVQCYDEFNRKRSIRDIDDEDHKFVVVISSSIFTDCSSGVEGGAIGSGRLGEGIGGEQTMIGTNDMKISDCNFTRCESGKGGALYFQDGTKEGDEETVIENSHFYECYANGTEHEGYAISCRSYQITVKNCDFHDHHSNGIAQHGTRDCVVYVETNEEEVQPTISGLTFENNNAVSGLAVNVSSGQNIEITELHFNHIQGDEPCINLDLWQSNKFITILDSTFSNVQNARCIMTKQSEHHLKIKFTKCKFENNAFTNTYPSTDFILPYGSSIYLQGEAEIIIDHCNFTNNTAVCGGGAIYAETQSIELSSNRFVDCSVSGQGNQGYGGAVFLNQELEGESEEEENYERVTGNIFINCHSSISGGAIYVHCHDEKHKRSIRDIDDENHKFVVVIEMSNFTDCSSGVEGGAICSGKPEESFEGEVSTTAVGTNDMKIAYCYFTRCESGKGGALYFQDGTKEGDEETVIENSHFYECYANGTEHEGYAISCRSYQITVKNCDFHDHHSNDGIAQYGTRDCVVYVETNEEEVQPTISGLTFENNNAVSGLIVNVSSKNQVVVSGLKFINIQGEACINLDLWDAKTHVRIENSEFNNVHNSRCILASNKDHSVKVTLFRCQFENNSLENIGTTGKNILPFGSSIYLQGRAEATISQCNFTNNTASLCGGAIYAETQSVALNVNRFVKCSSSGTKENHGGYGGAVYLNQQSEEVMIEENYELLSGNTFIDCHSTISGGAIFVQCYDEFNRKRSIRDIDDEDHKFVVVISSSIFTDCSSGVEGGAIGSGRLGEGIGGEQTMIGTNDMKISDCNFTRCESGKGGALYFQDGTKEGDEETVIENSHFYECYANGTEHEGYAISCRSYQITVKNCDFHDHHSNGIAQHGTRDCVVYVETNEEEVQPTISGLTFENNNAVSGLAVNVSSGQNIEITELHFNHIQGDEPCINLDLWQSNKFITILDSTFSNVQNARCIMTKQSEHHLKIKFTKCKFENNAFTNTYPSTDFILPYGSSIYLQGEAEIIIDHCNFTNNTAVCGGGAIYAETQSIELSSNRFVDCSVSGQGNQGYGGAVFLNQELEGESEEEENYERVTGNIFINCHSSISGGAIYVHCHDEKHKRSIRDIDDENHKFVVVIEM